MAGSVRHGVAWSAIVAISLLWGSALAPAGVPDCACGHRAGCLCPHEDEAPACHRAMGATSGPDPCSLTAPRPGADVELALLPVMVPSPLPAMAPSIAPGLAPARVDSPALPVASLDRSRPESPPPRLLG
ncbi:MAG: hypothetical protein R2991_07675 [Thermoanaerobaculia bacterium]